MANTYVSATHVADELQMRIDAKRGLLKHANREFTGDVQRKGSTITVEELPLQSWIDATDVAGDIALLNATATPYNIVISQGKEIGRHVGDIEQIRAAFDLKKGLFDSIAEGLAQLHEQHFLAQMSTDAGNTLATAVLTNLTIQTVLENMGVLLSEDNVPPTGRVCVLPPKAASLLRLSGIYVYTSEGLRNLEEGNVEMYGGAVLVESTLGPTNTILMFLSGVPRFIDQMSKIEVNKREARVGYALIGESYYQAKTVGLLTNCICKHVYTLA